MNYSSMQEIVPSIENRITTLNKVVSDAKKGFKNVVKSFWRKPREEVESTRGAVKYRHDKIEAQTLLLADTSFMIHVRFLSLTLLIMMTAFVYFVCYFAYVLNSG